jgi:hypothetical protein
MYKDKTQLRKDGHRTLESGMNSGRNPLLLTPQECAFASNVSFRGGFPTHRQKFFQVPLKDGGNAGVGVFQNGNFQGAAIYDVDDGVEYIMVMVGGELLQFDPTVSGPMPVTALWNDGLNAPNKPQAWFCQSDIYFIVQDGSATPLILQGIKQIRRAGASEIPVGTAMAYGQGRTWLAQGRQVVASDLLGGPTSVVSFTEQTYIGEAAFFGVPLTSGNIVGLIFIEQGDTSTGQGELLMFARNACYSIQAGVPRAATQTQPGWQGTPKMQSVAITNTGCTGWRNLLNVNMDVFFRSKDGWRTFRTARNEQYGWGAAPISHEVDRILPLDSLPLLDYASSAVFRNRVFLTTEPLPYRNTGSASFGGLIALDLNVISSVINKSNLAYEFSPYFSQRGSPAYDGFWTPPAHLRILQILAGTFSHLERCFVFCLNQSTNQTELWELLDDEPFDNVTIPVTCQIETRAFDCKLPDALKTLRMGELYFTALQATLQVTVEYRSDGYPAWTLWNTMTLVGHQSPCNVDTAVCQVPGCVQEGYWFQHRLSTPNGACDPNTNKLLKNGFFFQFRITWTGPATLLMFMIHCEELVETPQGGCP